MIAGDESMNPRSFISFDYDHNENDKNLFIGQSKNSRTPFDIADWSSTSEGCISV